MLSEISYNKLAPYKNRASHYVEHGIDVGGNTREMANALAEVTGYSMCTSCSAEITYGLTLINDLIKEYENGST
jgi:hypothetical protein